MFFCGSINVRQVLCWRQSEDMGKRSGELKSGFTIPRRVFFSNAAFINLLPLISLHKVLEDIGRER